MKSVKVVSTNGRETLIDMKNEGNTIQNIKDYEDNLIIEKTSDTTYKLGNIEGQFINFDIENKELFIIINQHGISKVIMILDDEEFIYLSKIISNFESQL